VDGIIQASLRGIDSHGIRLFPHYIQGFNKGRLNKNPKYHFKKTTSGTGIFDANHAPGHAAGIEAMSKAIELAENNGIAAISVCNSSHFGAAAYYGFKAAEKDMIGLSFTQATAHVLSYNGIQPFFGNNPICMVAPAEKEGPFCLDMATTITTFNKVEIYKESGKNLPNGWAVDNSGNETIDPKNVFSLLPIGGYKGFGLSMMVDILCALLSGSKYGPDTSPMFNNDMKEKRYLGHYFIAINIAAFVKPARFKKRMQEMIDRLRSEPKNDKNGHPVIVPGDPEKNYLEERIKFGIPVSKPFVNVLNQLFADYDLEDRI